MIVHSALLEVRTHLNRLSPLRARANEIIMAERAVLRALDAQMTTAEALTVLGFTVGLLVADGQIGLKEGLRLLEQATSQKCELAQSSLLDLGLISPAEARHRYGEEPKE